MSDDAADVPGAIDSAEAPAAAPATEASPAAVPAPPRGDNEAQRVYLRFRRVFGDPNGRSRDGRRRKIGRAHV